MRISDWSSDVCSSDLSDNPYSLLPGSADGWEKRIGIVATISRITLRLAGNGQKIPVLKGIVPLDKHPDVFPGSKNPARAGNHRGSIGRPKLGRSTVIIRRSEEHTSELQSLMRISYAVFCLKKKKK